MSYKAHDMMKPSSFFTVKSMARAAICSLLVNAVFLPLPMALAGDLKSLSADHPIHDLARTGTGEEISQRLKLEPEARDIRNVNGSTALHLAATNPDLSAIKALVAAGADCNARDNDGLTPLHMAAYTQKANQAQVLLECGADPYAKTNAGRDPTSMARKTMSNEVAGVISLWILKGCVAGKPC